MAVSLIAGPDRASTELTLNSFLRCCTDVSRVGRFLMIDAGLSAQDRALLRDRYGFLEFAQPATQLGQVRAQIHECCWLHLGQGWQFLPPTISSPASRRCSRPQHRYSRWESTSLTRSSGASAAENAVRRTPDAGRYVLTDAPARGPAMFDTARLDRACSIQGTKPDPIAGLGRRATAAGLQTASLDEVLCIANRG